jgi:hypothetical protein
MKKHFLLFVFLVAAVAGFSQMSKTDAAGFVSRNLPTAASLNFYNTVSQSSGTAYRSWTEYTKESVVSLTAMDSGLLLVIKHDSGNREKFFPYASILYMNVSSDNNFNIFLRD